MYDYKKIGERIKKERKSIMWEDADKGHTGMSIERLVDDLASFYDVHVTRQTMSSIEKGQFCSSLDIKMLLALCDTFDCDIEYLLCEQDEKHRDNIDACKRTGLTEDTIECIGRMSDIDKRILDAMALLHSPNSSESMLTEIIDEISTYCTYESNLTKAELNGIDPVGIAKFSVVDIFGKDIDILRDKTRVLREIMNNRMNSTE